MRAAGVLSALFPVVVSSAVFAAETPPAMQAGEIVRDGNVYIQPLDWLVALPGRAAVDIANTNGDISIEAWDQPEVHVFAEKRLPVRRGFLGLFNKDITDAESAMARTEVTVTSDAEGVHVKAKPGRGDSPSVHFVVKVPAPCDVEADTLNGGIEASHLAGTARLATVNGGITCTGQTGPAFLKSNNGRIRADECTGALEAETVNGQVSLNEVTGNVSAESVNGRITLAHPEPMAESQTIVCETVNGSVDVMVSGDSFFEYRLRSQNGRISNDFSDGTAVAAANKSPVTGVVGVGGAGARVDLKTTNGSVSLEAL